VVSVTGFLYYVAVLTVERSRGASGELSLPENTASDSDDNSEDVVGPRVQHKRFKPTVLK